MDLAIETERLTKFYGSTAAIRDLDWKVPVGSVCALLGSNGAGKSTTLRMLMGFTPPSRGSCRILGEDPWEMTPSARHRVGYVSEFPILPPWMTVGGLLKFHTGLYPRWKKTQETKLRELFEIADKQRISDLSKGQHRRLMLSLALCQDADLLLLDEPASGLDVAARRQFLSLLSEYLSEDHKTVIVSTHIVTDIERIASHVTILEAGRLVEFALLDELKEKVKRIRLPLDLFERTAPLWKEASVLEEEEKGHLKVLTVRSYSDEMRSTLEKTGGGAAEVLDLPLEEIFLAYTRNRGASSPC